MEYLGRLFTMILDFLATDFTILGKYNFNLLGVIIFTSVAGIVGWLLWEIIFG